MLNQFNNIMNSDLYLSIDCLQKHNPLYTL